MTSSRLLPFGKPKKVQRLPLKLPCPLAQSLRMPNLIADVALSVIMRLWDVDLSEISKAQMRLHGALHVTILVQSPMTTIQVRRHVVGIHSLPYCRHHHVLARIDLAQVARDWACGNLALFGEQQISGTADRLQFPAD